MSVWQGAYGSGSIFLLGSTDRTDRTGLPSMFVHIFTVMQLLHLHWPTGGGDRDARMEFTHIYGWACTHTHTEHTHSPSSSPNWCSCPESIHTNRIHLYMLLPQEPLQDFSFWPRQGTGVIDPSTATWRERLPAKMKSTCSHLVPVLQRPLARRRLLVRCTSTVSSQTHTTLVDIDWDVHSEVW